jgi:GT2 family glycosyltransferase
MIYKTSPKLATDLVGAIIVTHNSEDYLNRCLEGLRLNGINDVVVVDNASRDISYINNLATNVRSVFLPHNIGFGAASNVGARLINKPYLLFVNPDAMLQTAAVSSALKAMLDRDWVGAVGIMLVSVSGNIERGGFGNDVTMRRLLFRQIKPRIVPRETRAVAWVSGGALLVRQLSFQAVDGFDDQFFMYFEDVDLCRRLRVVGWGVMIEPLARAIHYRGHSSIAENIKTRQYDKSADMFFHKHYDKPIWLTQRWLRRLYRLALPRAR